MSSQPVWAGEEKKQVDGYDCESEYVGDRNDDLIEDYSRGGHQDASSVECSEDDNANHSQGFEYTDFHEKHEIDVSRINLDNGRCVNTQHNVPCEQSLPCMQTCGDDRFCDNGSEDYSISDSLGNDSDNDELKREDFTEYPDVNEDSSRLSSNDGMVKNVDECRGVDVRTDISVGIDGFQGGFTDEEVINENIDGGGGGMTQFDGCVDGNRGEQDGSALYINGIQGSDEWLERRQSNCSEFSLDNGVSGFIKGKGESLLMKDKGSYAQINKRRGNCGGGEIKGNISTQFHMEETDTQLQLRAFLESAITQRDKMEQQLQQRHEQYNNSNNKMKGGGGDGSKHNRRSGEDSDSTLNKRESRRIVGCVGEGKKMGLASVDMGDISRSCSSPKRREQVIPVRGNKVGRQIGNNMKWGGGSVESGGPNNSWNGGNVKTEHGGGGIMMPQDVCDPAVPLAVSLGNNIRQGPNQSMIDAAVAAASVATSSVKACMPMAMGDRCRGQSSLRFNWSGNAAVWPENVYPSSCGASTVHCPDGSDGVVGKCNGLYNESRGGAGMAPTCVPHSCVDMFGMSENAKLSYVDFKKSRGLETWRGTEVGGNPHVGRLLLLSEHLLQLLLQQVTPTVANREKKRNIYNTLVHFVENVLGRDVSLYLAGSTAYDVDAAGSDLDIVLLDRSSPFTDARGILQHLRDAIDQVQQQLASSDPDNDWPLRSVKLQLVESARVPILTLRTAEAAVVCDISVNTANSIWHSEFFGMVLQQRPQLRPLMRLLKVWGRSRRLPTMKEGGLPSIVWMTLVAYLCQPAEQGDTGHQSVATQKFGGGSGRFETDVGLGTGMGQGGQGIAGYSVDICRISHTGMGDYVNDFNGAGGDKGNAAGDEVGGASACDASIDCFPPMIHDFTTPQLFLSDLLCLPVESVLALFPLFVSLLQFFSGLRSRRCLSQSLFIMATNTVKSPPVHKHGQNIPSELPSGNKKLGGTPMGFPSSDTGAQCDAGHTAVGGGAGGVSLSVLLSSDPKRSEECASRVLSTFGHGGVWDCLLSVYDAPRHPLVVASDGGSPSIALQQQQQPIAMYPRMAQQNQIHSSSGGSSTMRQNISEGTASTGKPSKIGGAPISSALSPASATAVNAAAFAATAAGLGGGGDPTIDLAARVSSATWLVYRYELCRAYSLLDSYVRALNRLTLLQQLFLGHAANQHLQLQLLEKKQGRAAVTAALLDKEFVHRETAGPTLAGMPLLPMPPHQLQEEIDALKRDLLLGVAAIFEQVPDDRYLLPVLQQSSETKVDGGLRVCGTTNTDPDYLGDSRGGGIGMGECSISVELLAPCGRESVTWLVAVLEGRLFVLKVIKCCQEGGWWTTEFLSRRDTRTTLHARMYMVVRFSDLKRRIDSSGCSNVGTGDAEHCSAAAYQATKSQAKTENGREECDLPHFQGQGHTAALLVPAVGANIPDILLCPCNFVTRLAVLKLTAADMKLFIAPISPYLPVAATDANHLNTEGLYALSPEEVARLDALEQLAACSPWWHTQASELQQLYVHVGMRAPLQPVVRRCRCCGAVGLPCASDILIEAEEKMESAVNCSCTSKDETVAVGDEAFTERVWNKNVSRSEVDVGPALSVIVRLSASIASSSHENRGTITADTLASLNSNSSSGDLLEQHQLLLQEQQVATAGLASSTLVAAAAAQSILGLLWLQASAVGTPGVLAPNLMLTYPTEQQKLLTLLRQRQQQLLLQQSFYDSVTGSNRNSAAAAQLQLLMAISGGRQLQAFGGQLHSDGQQAYQDRILSRGDSISPVHMEQSNGISDISVVHEENMQRQQKELHEAISNQLSHHSSHTGRSYAESYFDSSGIGRRGHRHSVNAVYESSYYQNRRSDSHSVNAASRGSSRSRRKTASDCMYSSPPSYPGGTCVGHLSDQRERMSAISLMHHKPEGMVDRRDSYDGGGQTPYYSKNIPYPGTHVHDNERGRGMGGEGICKYKRWADAGSRSSSIDGLSESANVSYADCCCRIDDDTTSLPEHPEQSLLMAGGGVLCDDASQAERLSLDRHQVQDEYLTASSLPPSPSVVSTTKKKSAVAVTTPDTISTGFQSVNVDVRGRNPLKHRAEKQLYVPRALRRMRLGDLQMPSTKFDDQQHLSNDKQWIREQVCECDGEIFGVKEYECQTKDMVEEGMLGEVSNRIGFGSSCFELLDSYGDVQDSADASGCVSAEISRPSTSTGTRESMKTRRRVVEGVQKKMVSRFQAPKLNSFIPGVSSDGRLTQSSQQNLNKQCERSRGGFVNTFSGNGVANTDPGGVSNFVGVSGERKYKEYFRLENSLELSVETKGVEDKNNIDDGNRRERLSHQYMASSITQASVARGCSGGRVQEALVNSSTTLLSSASNSSTPVSTVNKGQARILQFALNSVTRAAQRSRQAENSCMLSQVHSASGCDQTNLSDARGNTLGGFENSDAPNVGRD